MGSSRQTPKLPYKFCPLPADGRRRLAFSDLPARAYKVLLAILGLTLERLDSDGRRKTWTRATDKTLADACGCCDRRVRRALVDLERLSWIQRNDTGNRDAPREIRLGPALIDLWLSDRDEREMAAGQQFFAWDRPELPGPAKVVQAGPDAWSVPVEQPLRKAVGYPEDFAVRTEVSGLSGQICPPLPLITENDHRIPPPPSSVEPSATMCATRLEEEGVSLVESEKSGQETTSKPVLEAHIAGGYGPPRGDHGSDVAKCGPAGKEGLGVDLDAKEAKAWGTWVRAWDGLAPLPMESERSEDLRTLVSDCDRLGCEVLEAAIRHGRAEHARGRLRIFDLRRYCAGLRSSLLAAGLAAVKKRRSERLAAAQPVDRMSWDQAVKDRARALRAREPGLAYSESIREAEAEMMATAVS